MKYFSATASLLLCCVLLSCGDPDDLGAELLGDCPTDEDFFRVRVQAPIFSQRCAACHAVGGVADHTSFVLQTELDGEGWIAANFATASALALTDGDEEGNSLLLLKPTDRADEDHGGGIVLTPDSPSYADLIEFVGRVRGDIDDCGEGTVHGPGLVDCSEGELPGPRVLRRLTHAEYGSTVRDLLGTELQPELDFAPDNLLHGFTNQAEALQVPPLLAEQYRGAAELLASEAVEERLASLLPCEASEGQACAEEFVVDFGLRAFRRPLTEADVDRYMEVWSAAAADGGFESGIEWTLAGMLQSPHFLYRSELGARTEDDLFALSSWELASELSYLVVGSTPDAELLEAAESGTLATADGLAEQLSRLLADPRALETSGAFFEAWLQLDRLPVVPRDAEAYPELTESVRTEMAGETERLVADVLGSEGSLEDLFLAQHSFMTDSLADYYGLPAGSGEADAAGYRRVELGDTPYGGILTQGSLLTIHALPSSSSPIHRGLLVRERLLCHELPPPPANLNTSPPAVDPGLSTRERYAVHSEIAECAVCHDLIDPIGFGFEHFDGVGRWRATDGPHEVDDSGFISESPSTDAEFVGIEELATLLADSSDVESCYVRQWIRYGAGMSEEGSLACSVDPMLNSLEASGGRLTAVFEALVSTPHFWFREGGSAELDAPAAGGEPLPVGDDDDAAPGDDDDDDATPGDDDDDATPDPSLQTTVVYASDWGDGYCVDVEVLNTSSSAVTWEVELSFEGSFSSVWNANWSELGGGDFLFSGVDWNATLQAGQTAAFGLCAQRN